MIGPITIPFSIISSGNGGQMFGPLHPPKNKTVNKAANAGLYAIKILATEFSELRPKLRKFKEKQHHSVLAESDELKKSGLVKFVAKKFK